MAFLLPENVISKFLERSFPDVAFDMNFGALEASTLRPDPIGSVTVPVQLELMIQRQLKPQLFQLYGSSRALNGYKGGIGFHLSR